jgi:branched-chain amino acid transport system permease protein
MRPPVLDVSLGLQLVVYGLTNGAVVALNAIGFSLAYAVARQINLAHGNVFALTTVLVASFASWIGITPGDPTWVRLVVLLALVCCGAVSGAALNAGIERLAFRPFRGRDPVAPLIATVGLSFFLFQVAIWWRALFPNPRTTSTPLLHLGDVLPLLAMPDLVPSVQLLGRGGLSFTLKDLLVLLLAGGVALGVAAFLARTRSGRLLRAVAQDLELVSLSGGDPERARLLAFALAGGLAGFAAAIFSAYYGAASGQFGLRTGLAAITAAVLGGVGNARGALLAGLLIGVFSSFSDYLLDPQWTPVLVLGLLISLLAMRSAGAESSTQTAERATASREPAPAVAETAGAGTRWLLLALLGLGLVYPVVDQLAGWHRLPSMSASLLMVTLGLGLSIVVGFAGLIDLGYAAFFAIGGYTAALLTSSGSRVALALPEWSREPWLALPLAGLAAAGCGYVFGLPSIRTRGEYLAIVTLAFGEIVPGVIWHIPYWTGGPNGLSGIPTPRLGPLADLAPALNGYFLGLALATVACLAALRLARSRLGRAWAATRDDEMAAEAVGVDAPRTKLLAFAIGAGCAGLAGGLYAGLLRYVEPGQFDLTVSLMVLGAVVLGGRWGIVGVVLGALTVAAYDRVLADLSSALVRTVGTAAGIGVLERTDLRSSSFALFGGALYLAILLRARPLQQQLARGGRTFGAVRQPYAQGAVRLDPEHDDGHDLRHIPVSQPQALAAPPEAGLPGRLGFVDRSGEPGVDAPDERS